MKKNKDLEYNDYLKLFSKRNFKKRIEKLSKKFKNKRVLIYGNGIFCDALTDKFDFKKYFNIIGTSDIRYLKEKPTEYKTFKVFDPYEIKNLNVDIILCTTINPESVLLFFKNHNIISEKTQFYSFLDRKIKENQLLKTFCLLKYFLETFDHKKTKKYSKVLSTEEINSKINYHKLIKKFKKRNTKKHPLKVCFLVEENAKWGLQSVYDNFKKDENFKILPILCYPIITKNRTQYTQKDNIEFFKKLNIEATDGYNPKTGEFITPSDLKADILFYQQPYYIKKSWHPATLSESTLTCVVSYGYSSIDVKSWGGAFIQNFSGNLWKMFAESPYHKLFYEEAAKIKDKDILKVTGYPKTDFYFEPVKEEFEKLWKDENNKKPRIIWAPHHSVNLGGLEMSNFNEHYKFFLNFAKNNPQYSFVFKPHPMLKFKVVEEAKLMKEEEYNNYIKEWESLKNASVYDKGNYFDIFKTSDVLITDCSSFLGEYYFSKKPIIFLNKDTRADFNDFGLKIKETFYTAHSTNDIEKFINQLLVEKNDYKLNERIKLIEQEYFYPKEGAGKYIVDYIKKEVLK